MTSRPDLEVYRQNTTSEESNTFVGGFNYVSRVSVDGMLRVIERLQLEGQNITIKNVPIGGRKGMEDLLGIFGKARQGFRLLTQTDNRWADKIDPAKFLNVVGTSSEDDAEKFINEFSTIKELTKPNGKFSLSVAMAFTATLLKLAKAETVNFYYLGIIPTGDNPSLILRPSYWKYNISPETIWGGINAAELCLKEALLQKGSIANTDRLYKAAHFLGANLSMKMVN